MYNLYSLKIKELLFSPIRSTSVHFGLLQSTLVPFSPSWSTGDNFFSSSALFRPRAYKNRAFGGKTISPVGTRVSGKIFFPRCSVFVGSRPKQSTWGKKNCPSGPNWTEWDKWTEVDLIGPNSNSLILKEYKLYIILQVQNN